MSTAQSMPILHNCNNHLLQSMPHPPDTTYDMPPVQHNASEAANTSGLLSTLMKCDGVAAQVATSTRKACLIVST